jgi:hypothetical protein
LVDSPIFRQENELRDWLTDQPQVTHRKLAMLGALRILPLALEKPIGELETSADQWTEADALEHDQRCLAIFRAAITGTTAAWDRNSLLDHAAKKARQNLRTLEKTKSAVLRTTSKAANIFKFAALVNSPDILSRDRSAKFAAFSLEEGWTLLRDISTATEREEWQVDPELAWDVAHNVEFLTPSHLRLFNASSQPAQSTHAWAKFCKETGPQPSPWQFWREWYQGMLDGTPMDWDLQLQVALIKGPIWDAGPEAVANEIRVIRKAIQSTSTEAEQRFSEFEPSSLDRVYANAPMINVSLSHLSVQIEEARSRFHENGPNQIPETFQFLVELPGSLERVTSILRQPARTSETEDKLRAEIGRLKAQAASLEHDLKAALEAEPSGFTHTLKEQLGRSLGDWKLFAALAGGLWVISGDDVGAAKRAENLLYYREALFGDVCPSPDHASLASKIENTHSTKSISK